MKRFYSRKFLFFVGVVTSATWLVSAGHVADGVYSAVVIAALGAYQLVNVAQKKIEKDAA